MTSSVNKNDKLSRKEFLEIVSMNYKIPMKELEKSYNAIFSSLVNEVLAGRNVCLTGIGLFYLQKHKGHSVQFKMCLSFQHRIHFTVKSEAVI